MKKYAEMSDAEFAAECNDVVATLATRLTTLSRTITSLSRHGAAGDDRAILEFTLCPIMEGLGDILNGMDADDKFDMWTYEIFTELHRRLSLIA